MGDLTVTYCALFGPPQKGGVRQPILILSSRLIGDPRECRGSVAIPPSFGPLEGRGEVANSDFLHVLGFGDPSRMRGLRSNSALFWAP